MTPDNQTEGLSVENVRLTQMHAPFMLSYGSEFRERLNALLNAARAAPPGYETGWLIEGEMPDGSPGWMTLKLTEALWGVVLSKDSTAALRFARRDDAEDYFATHIDDGPFRITEHQWIAARPQAEGGA